MSNSSGENFGDLIDQNANLRTLAPAAVGSQVLLMSIVSVVLVVRCVAYELARLDTAI